MGRGLEGKEGFNELQVSKPLCWMDEEEEEEEQTIPWAPAARHQASEMFIAGARAAWRHHCMGL